MSNIWFDKEVAAFLNKAPMPAPRSAPPLFEIRFTRQVQDRCRARAVSEAAICDAIVNGREECLAGAPTFSRFERALRRRPRDAHSPARIVVLALRRPHGCLALTAFLATGGPA